MRDAHRMKEKFDVSLDNRQIVSLLIAGIVVMGAVFVLGVVVGKKLAGNADAVAAPDLLSALDANAQALQNVQQEPPLTFPDELTRKAAPEPVAPPKPKPAAVAKAPAEKPAAAKPSEPKPVTAQRPVLAPTPDPDTGELPPEEPKAEPERVVVAEAPTQAVPVSGKVEASAVPTRSTTTEGGGLKEAIARATQQPSRPASPPAQAVKGGAFTLQLSAFQDRQEADRFAARLRDRGYAPYILTAEVPGKGTWYRVRMGSFASRDAATRYLSDFKRETSLDAFVAGTN
ncbi:SPOR domain-containing protein [Corallococcus macrosporus]|uniref:Gliding motility protein n=1 Tax=Corallococcus macrosporus DSM 14697 TaxID=1189310 RepID=A0A250JVE7_9BACT|nr:SPOR domain-containing protein [Corallococcus macrosporus]ATB47825.1 gliding motility protein [Corallococcus macrosporus DSM 14697]